MQQRLPMVVNSSSRAIKDDKTHAALILTEKQSIKGLSKAFYRFSTDLAVQDQFVFVLQDGNLCYHSGSCFVKVLL